MATSKTKKSFLPSIRLEDSMLKELDELVNKFGYRSRYELIREAIADKIAELKGAEIIELRDLSKEDAKKEILEYIEHKDIVYASDIANDLGLDLKMTFEIIDELFKEDLLEEV